MTSGDTVLRLRPLVTGVVRTARQHAWRILAVSVVVSAVSVLAELIADRLLGRAGLASALAGSLASSAVGLLGAVFLSGFLGRLVSKTGPGLPGKTGAKAGPAKTGPGKSGPAKTGPAKAGPGKSGPDAPGTRIRDVLRSLPWGSLILADLLATAVVVAGLLALIVPGLVAMTLLAVVGPVIEIERRPALSGLRRSARLVRPRFWRVAAFGTLPLLLSSGIAAILPDPAGHVNAATTLVVRSVGEGVLDSVVGLLLVELGYGLIADARAAARQAAPPAALPGRASPGALPHRGRGRGPGLMVPAGEGRLGRGRPEQGGQRGREPAAGRLPGDPFRVGGRVHVE